MPAIRTAAQAKAWLEQQGKSVQEFARENSVDPATTYQILSGRKKGRRGESHKVAVLLGMKVGVIPAVVGVDESIDASPALASLAAVSG